MTAAHTPEPWGPEEGPITLHGKQWSLLSPVDYERARVCTNACKGISTPILESLAKITGLRGVMDRLTSFRDQRDEMLERLAGIATQAETGVDPLQIAQQVRALVARAQKDGAL